MKKRITRISIHSTSMTVASMYAIVILAIGIVIMVVGTPIALIAGRALDNDMSVGIWIAGALAFTVFGTIFYALAAYAFTALTSFLYNIVVNWTGGIEFELSDSDEWPPDPSTSGQG